MLIFWTTIGQKVQKEGDQTHSDLLRNFNLYTMINSSDGAKIGIFLKLQIFSL